MKDVVVLALAVAAASLTFTKSPLFAWFRVWWIRRSELAEDLVRCPYCMSHWIAAAGVLATGTSAGSFGGPVRDFVVTWLCVVALAALATRFMEWPKVKQ